MNYSFPGNSRWNPPCACAAARAGIVFVRLCAVALRAETSIVIRTGGRVTALFRPSRRRRSARESTSDPRSPDRGWQRLVGWRLPVCACGWLSPQELLRETARLAKENATEQQN